MRNLSRSGLIAAGCLWVLCCASTGRAQLTAEQCLYLPPSFADRVVFYHGFELGMMKPEINRIGAEIWGSGKIVADGFAGAGWRALRQAQEGAAAGQGVLQIHARGLSVDHPITVMRWWRVDAPMKLASCFQLLALKGPTGHISCFVRGKGEWCGLTRPTMYVQVDGFGAITNVNWRVRENAYFEPGQWHHAAITVAGASEICYYVDGQPLASVHAKGRLFGPGDIDTLEPSSGGVDYSEHPTTTDELVVVDRVLGASEIAAYYQGSLSLREMGYRPVAGGK